MTEQELREKIVEVLSAFKITGFDKNNECIFEKSIPTSILEEVADLLIAAGCTFDNKHRVLFENVSLPDEYIGNECFFIPKTQTKIKQLYGDEEVEQIVKERDEYKHRAEVAEKALDKATELAYTYRTQDDTLSCSSCPFDSIFDRCKERGLYKDCSKRWKEELLQKAEKELQEERKDD